MAALLAAATAWPQTPPDAGRLLQQERPAPQAPTSAPAIDGAAPASTPALAGGTRVELKAIRFSGNTVFSDAQLGAVLGPVAGQSLDLAGLQALADRVSDHYLSLGFPFARAYLPAQRFSDGALEIAVLEGRYGEVRTTGDPALAAPALAFLSPLKPGDTIAAAPLERVTLLLSDLPGIDIRPLVRPGQAIGTGDLVVEVRSTPRWQGGLVLDNHGNRFAGAQRASFDLRADSPFLFGDQLSLKVLTSDAGQWLGQAAYSLPLGTAGWRAQLSHARTRYELGKEFSNLQASGTADVSSVGLSYPWLRSRETNLNLSLLPQHKQLKDQQAATASNSRKSSEALSLALNADHRDTLGGGGVTYGSLSATVGTLRLGAAQRANDAATARTQGVFRKLNLDVARHQATPVAGLTLYGRFAAQWSAANLDSSEDFGLGGADGVRAYPGGEAYGDEGALLQLEARYAIGAFAPYVFHDQGHVRFNRQPWAAGRNTRSVGGGGVGLRYHDGSWSLDLALAWRDQSGAPTSDGTDKAPRVWMQAGWRF